MWGRAVPFDCAQGRLCGTPHIFSPNLPGLTLRLCSGRANYPGYELSSPSASLRAGSAGLQPAQRAKENSPGCKPGVGSQQDHFRPAGGMRAAARAGTQQEKAALPHPWLVLSEVEGRFSLGGRCGLVPSPPGAPSLRSGFRQRAQTPAKRTNFDCAQGRLYGTRPVLPSLPSASALG
jgi:hypothetical protein